MAGYSWAGSNLGIQRGVPYSFPSFDFEEKVIQEGVGNDMINGPWDGLVACSRDRPLGVRNKKAPRWLPGYYQH